MADQYFLKIDGIEGESRDEQHKYLRCQKIQAFQNKASVTIEDKRQV